MEEITKRNGTLLKHTDLEKEFFTFHPILEPNGIYDSSLIKENEEKIMKTYALIDGCNRNESELKGICSSEEKAQIGFKNLKSDSSNSFNWFWIEEWEIDGKYIRDIECDNN